MWILGALGAVGVVVGFVTFLPPLLLLAPGRPWMWTWQIVAIVVAIVGGCLVFSSQPGTDCKACAEAERLSKVRVVERSR